MDCHSAHGLHARLVEMRPDADAVEKAGIGRADGIDAGIPFLGPRRPRWRTSISATERRLSRKPTAKARPARPPPTMATSIASGFMGTLSRKAVTLDKASRRRNSANITP
jgi:hypothetical protein